MQGGIYGPDHWLYLNVRPEVLEAWGLSLWPQAMWSGSQLQAASCKLSHTNTRKAQEQV